MIPDVDAGAADGGDRGGGDGDREAPPELLDDPHCGCEPTDEYYCQLIDTPCESDSDCDDGLACEAWAISVGACRQPPAQDAAEPEDGPTGEGPPATTATAPPKPMEAADVPVGDSDGPIPTEPSGPYECEPVEEIVHRRCLPPGYWGFPTTGSTTGGGEAMTPAGPGGMGNTAGDPGPAPIGEPAEQPQAPPAQGDAGGQSEAQSGLNDDTNAEEHGEGRRGLRGRRHRRFRPWLWCAASPGAEDDRGSVAWLALPALVLLRRRRRAR